MWKPFQEDEWLFFYLQQIYDKFRGGKEISFFLIEYFKNRLVENPDIEYFRLLNAKLCSQTVKDFFPFIYSRLKDKTPKTLLEIYKLIYQIVEEVIMVLIDNDNFKLDYWRLYSGFRDLPFHFSKPFFNSHYGGWLPNIDYRTFYDKYSREPDLWVIEGDDYLNTIWQECCLIIEEWNGYINGFSFREFMISIYKKESEFLFDELIKFNEKIDIKNKKPFTSFYIQQSMNTYNEKWRFMFPFHKTDLIIKFKEPNTEFFDMKITEKITNLINFCNKN